MTGLYDGTVEVLDEKVEFVFRNFRVIKRTEKHIKFDGTWSRPRSWLVFERPDSVAILIYDKLTDRVVLVEQVRPAMIRRDRTLLEIPAGTMDLGESVYRCARREAAEEVGIRPLALKIIDEIYPSPGGSSEKITLLIASFDPSMVVGKGGGVEKEGEDIAILWVTRAEVIDLLERRMIKDAKTKIALNYFVYQTKV